MHACLVVQLCPTLCDSMNCSPPSSSFHGIFQVRILEWVAISRPRDWTPISRVSCTAGRVLFLGRSLGCSVAHEIFPGPGIEPVSSGLLGRFLTTEPTGKSQSYQSYNFVPFDQGQLETFCHLLHSYYMSVWVLGTSASLFAVICSHPHFTEEEPESQRDAWGFSVHEVQKCGTKRQLLWLLSKPTLPTTLGRKRVFALCVCISIAPLQIGSSAPFF